ncbi:radical SAM protein [Acinetobacter baumannii]
MNIGILLWNTCNARCEHCAVSSGPTEKPVMSNEDIFKVIDATFYNTKHPYIGLSGGEAFFFFDRLKLIVEYASKKGAQISINTNAFWGKNENKAMRYVKEIKESGANKLVVSTDDFHTPYVNEECVINVIRACFYYHLEVDIQYVVSKDTTRLYDFLKRNSDKLLNVNTREIPVHPVGRAEKSIKENSYIGNKKIPKGLCPSSILSVSADGRLIPCCNTAGHLKQLGLGTVDDDIVQIYEKFNREPLFYTIRKYGPSSLYAKAQEYGLEDPKYGYVDQCHLCYEMFKDETRAEKLKNEARKISIHDIYSNYEQLFQEKFQNKS